MPTVARRLAEALARIAAGREDTGADGAFRVLFEQSPHAQFLVDADGTLLLANAATEALIGDASKEWIGRAFEALCAEPERTLSWTLNALRDARGEPVAWIATADDVTERVRLQQQVAATAALHGSMLQMATDPIVVIDRFGIVQSASASVQTMFGWLPEELVGQNVSVLMTEPHRSQHDAYLQHYLATGTSSVLGRLREFIVRRKDGTLLTCELSAFRIDIPGAEHPVFCGFFRDASERKRAQAREAAHLASLGTIAEAASVLAHEIKNPITGLRHALRALAGKLGADEQEIIGELVERMQRLERRMRRSLAFLRSPELVPERCELGQLARDVVTDMRPLWEGKRARVEVQAPASCDADVDPPLLHDVLANLLGNAIDAIQPGGRIEIRVRRAGGDVQLEVEDDGPGIPPAIRETLFQPFVTSKPGGTGLGLMICKRIVEAHAGRIEARDGRQRGALFVVTLPAGGDHARLSR